MHSAICIVGLDGLASFFRCLICVRGLMFVLFLLCSLRLMKDNCNDHRPDVYCDELASSHGQPFLFLSQGGGTSNIHRETVLAWSFW